jgi:predicted ester cyclase
VIGLNQALGQPRSISHCGGADIGHPQFVIPGGYHVSHRQQRVCAPLSGCDQRQGDADPALKQHIAYAEAAFPRYEMIVEDILADKDEVTVRFTMRATHTGEYMGIPATGKQVAVPGIIIYRVAGGKIVEHWMQFDAVSMMQQLGVQ